MSERKTWKQWFSKVDKEEGRGGLEKGIAESGERGERREDSGERKMRKGIREEREGMRGRLLEERVCGK